VLTVISEKVHDAAHKHVGGPHWMGYIYAPENASAQILLLDMLAEGMFAEDMFAEEWSVFTKRYKQINTQTT
jgi:hypothetical protein